MLDNNITNKYADKLMMDEDTIYGFTLNPAEQCYTAPTDQTFIQCYAVFVKRLLALKEIYPYVELYPEYTSCMSVGFKKTQPRLHFHGACTIDAFKFYTYGSARTLKYHSYDFNVKTDLEYCTKNRDPMKKWCSDWHVPYQITWESLDKPEVKNLLKSWWKIASKDNISDALYDP